VFIVAVLPWYYLTRFQLLYSNTSERVPMDHFYHKQYISRDAESILIHGSVTSRNLWCGCEFDVRSGMDVRDLL
jgi:hypothetical protein